MGFDDFRKRCQNAMMKFQRQYNIRNIDVVVNPRKNLANKPSASYPKKDDLKKEAQMKVQEESKVENPKEVEKVQNLFSLENELPKIKIVVPLAELLKNVEYRTQITGILKPLTESSDSLNLQDDCPTLLFGPQTENNRDEYVPPFYISLNVHDKVLHNVMLDSRASHNMMPKVIMEKLGLEVTRSYRDLFSFDSKHVKCLGMIKDFVVTGSNSCKEHSNGCSCG